MEKLVNDARLVNDSKECGERGKLWTRWSESGLLLDMEIGIIRTMDEQLVV